MGCVALNIVRAIASLYLDFVMAQTADDNYGLDNEGNCKFEHDGGLSSTTVRVYEEYEEDESEVAVYYRSLREEAAR